MGDDRDLPEANNLDTLILAHLDGTATDAERDQLARALQSSPEVADRFVALSRVHEDMLAVYDDKLAIEVADQSRGAPTPSRMRRISVRRSRARRIAFNPALFAVAALAVIGVGLFMIAPGGGDAPRRPKQARSRERTGIEPSVVTPRPRPESESDGDSWAAKAVAVVEESPPPVISDDIEHAVNVDDLLEDDHVVPPSFAASTRDAVPAPEPVAPPVEPEPRPAPAVAVLGVVYESTGLVLRARAGDAGEPAIVRDGSGVLDGDRYITKHGRAKLSLHTGSWVHVDRHSQLTIDATDGHRISLATGGVFVEVPHAADAKKELSVTTPFGTITHIGTRFGVSHRIATEVEVIDGKVRVENERGSVELEERQAARLIARKVKPRGPLPTTGKRFAWALGPDGLDAPTRETFDAVAEGELPEGWKVDPESTKPISVPWQVVNTPDGNVLTIPTSYDAANVSTECVAPADHKRPTETRIRFRMDPKAYTDGRTRWGIAIFLFYVDTGTNYRLRFYHPGHAKAEREGGNQWLSFSKRFYETRQAMAKRHSTTIMGMGSVEMYPMMAPGAWYRMAFKATPRRDGTLLEGKLWPDGTPEPRGWQLRYLDRDRPIRHGRSGLYLQRCTGEVDEFEVR